MPLVEGPSRRREQGAPWGAQLAQIRTGQRSRYWETMKRIEQIASGRARGGNDRVYRQLVCDWVRPRREEAISFLCLGFVFKEDHLI